jgi:type II secretory pathway pseudopilin PulG
VKRSDSGFASLIAIVVVLLIVFFLMREQLAGLLPKGPGSTERTAADAARVQAERVEQLQRERMRQAEDVVGP